MVFLNVSQRHVMQFYKGSHYSVEKHKPIHEVGTSPISSRTTCEAHNTCVLLSEEWLILETLISSNLPIIHYSLILIRVREKKYVPELFLEETVTFTKLLSNCKCRNITFKHFENIVQNNAANRYLCHMSIISNRGKF